MKRNCNSNSTLNQRNSNSTLNQRNPGQSHQRNPNQHNSETILHNSETTAILEALKSTQNQEERKSILSALNVKEMMNLRSVLISKNSIITQGKHLIDAKKFLKERLVETFKSEKISFERVVPSAGKVLEKIRLYEAVHQIKDEQDLMHRIEGKNRFCYLFAHHDLPNEPLAFVQVALTQEIPTNIQDILAVENNSKPDLVPPFTATFYSITSPQRGLSGIDLGSRLIKRVLNELSAKFGNDIHVYCTLSPIPGFRNWLETRLQTDSSLILLSKDEKNRLQEFYNRLNPQSDLSNTSSDDMFLFKYFLDKKRLFDARFEPALREILLRICLHYIVGEKRRGFAFDKVSNFHLSNGAFVLNQLHWRADASDKGFAQSFGIMINYIYDVPTLSTNAAGYNSNGTILIKSKL